MKSVIMSKTDKIKINRMDDYQEGNGVSPEMAYFWYFFVPVILLEK